LTRVFIKERKNRKERDDFRNEWENINQDNALWKGKSRLRSECPELFRHLCESCRIFNRKMIKIGNVTKDLKDVLKDKWINKYQKITRDFFNEYIEQSNREARDPIIECNELDVRNNDVSVDFYLIGIDASIKVGNPDIALVEKDLKLADNDSAILLRSLALKIQNLEVNRLNDINIGMVLDDIAITGKEVDEKCTKIQE
jgi:hypothetical protein